MADENASGPILRTAPDALLYLLERAYAQPNASVAAGWASTLEAEFGTPEFDRNHAAVVQLWRETSHLAQCLPHEQQRTRGIFANQEHALWSMIIAPDVAYNNQMGHVIDRVALDSLGMAADVLSGVYGASPVPGTTDEYLEGLSDDVDSLRTTTLKAPITPLMRLSLLETFAELDDKIAHGHLFGKAPIEASGYETSSRCLAAGVGLDDGEEKDSFLKRGMSVLDWTVRLGRVAEGGNILFSLTKRSGDDLKKAIDAAVDDEAAE